MTDLNIALVQSNITWENRDINLESFNNKLEEFDGSTDLIVLPEMFSTGFTMNVGSCSENEHGRAVTWMRELAIRKNCVIAGSVLIEENDQYYNRMYWMKPDGSYEKYDKRHLFRMGNEHLTMSQGKKQKIVNLKGWNINLQICYDLRFPVWSKNRYKDGKYEYDALMYIANWPEVRSHAYKSLIVARAIENQAYVIWVNRIGQDGNNYSYAGDTMIVDPMGNIIVKARVSEEQIITGILSKQKLEDFRERFKVGLDWDQFSV